MAPAARGPCSVPVWSPWRGGAMLSAALGFWSSQRRPGVTGTCRLAWKRHPRALGTLWGHPGCAQRGDAEGRWFLRARGIFWGVFRNSGLNDAFQEVGGADVSPSPGTRRKLPALTARCLCRAASSPVRFNVCSSSSRALPPERERGGSGCSAALVEYQSVGASLVKRRVSCSPENRLGWKTPLRSNPTVTSPVSLRTSSLRI